MESLVFLCSCTKEQQTVFPCRICDAKHWLSWKKCDQKSLLHPQMLTRGFSSNQLSPCQIEPTHWLQIWSLQITPLKKKRFDYLKVSPPNNWNLSWKTLTLQKISSFQELTISLLSWKDYPALLQWAYITTYEKIADQQTKNLTGSGRLAQRISLICIPWTIFSIWNVY